MTSRSRTVALKDHWSGPTVSTGFDTRLLLRLLGCALLLKQAGIFAALIVTGHFDGTMFTYWNYLGILGFYTLLVASLIFERAILTFTMLFVFPIMLGSTLLVAVAIVIIIQQNAAVFTAGGGPDVALSLIHTGDWVLHQLPLVEMLMLLGYGLILYARQIIACELSQMRTGEGRALYVLYFVLSPLVPFAVYCTIFDPDTHYPTGVPLYLLWLGLVAVNIAWMSGWLCAFTCTSQVEIKVYRFFGIVKPSTAKAEEEEETAILHEHPVPWEQQLLRRRRVPSRYVEDALVSEEPSPVPWVNPSPASFSNQVFLPGVPREMVLGGTVQL
jgi:hypothetical protein